MQTYFLKFFDEDVAQEVLSGLEFYIAPIGNNPGYYKTADIGWAFDPIGIITEGGVWDNETGEELTAPTTQEGWHANYAGATLPPELEAFVLDPPPSTPFRVFA